MTLTQRSCLLLFLSVFLGVALGICYGQEQPKPATSPVPAEIRVQEQILLSILRSLDQLELELKTKQEELRSPQGEGRREELTQQIQRIGERLSTLRENLNEIASGVDLKVFARESPEEDIDWKKSMLDLLRPVLNELTRLTARPREIEHLRTEIARYHEQQQVTEKALQNIDKLLKQQKEPTLKPHLQRLYRNWEQYLQEIGTQLSITNQQLKQTLGEQRPLAESIQHIVQLFFRSRGWNLLIAGLAFAAFWLLTHRLQNWLQGRQRFQKRQRTFSLRLFMVASTLLKIVGATFIFLLVLYFFEDWVLLTLAILFLLGIIWTSKNTLPRFVHEGMLLLNLGAVREGERVIYNGVPWLVRSLNFYTHLVNPELEGGDIRLPLRDFAELRSRPFQSGEPWFPTRPDDWILLDDGTLAKVVMQTPEVVRLVLLGGGRRTISVADFLAQMPTVLSTGFRIEVDFGMDYQHQAIITREIPTILTTALREALVQAGFEKSLVNLKAEFSEAGASSLNVRVLADFTGAAAPSRNVLKRAIQRICVEACNEHHWVIPFAQLTLHMASHAGNGAAPTLTPRQQEASEDHTP